MFCVVLLLNEAREALKASLVESLLQFVGHWTSMSSTYFGFLQMFFKVSRIIKCFIMSSCSYPLNHYNFQAFRLSSRTPWL